MQTIRSPWPPLKKLLRGSTCLCSTRVRSSVIKDAVFFYKRSNTRTKQVVLWAGPNNELQAYDPVSMTWFDLSNLAVAGIPPSARYGHGFTCAEGKLYVHGGFDGNGS
jgi:hypothetical protein